MYEFWTWIMSLFIHKQPNIISDNILPPPPLQHVQPLRNWNGERAASPHSGGGGGVGGGWIHINYFIKILIELGYIQSVGSYYNYTLQDADYAYVILCMNSEHESWVYLFTNSPISSLTIFYPPPPPPPTCPTSPQLEWGAGSFPPLWGGGGGGLECDQISDIRPPKKSNIRYQTPKKIKYQIISCSQKSDIWLKKIRYHTP